MEAFLFLLLVSLESNSAVIKFFSFCGKSNLLEDCGITKNDPFLQAYLVSF